MGGSSISVKGQVTVPKSIRQSLNLKTGDRVTFVADGDKAIMISMKDDFFSLKGILKKYRKGKPMSIREMHDTAKRHVVKRYWAHRHGSAA